jgi:hypothetical protein
MRHISVLTLLIGVLALGACATPSKPYTPPVDKPLQDPLPGQAVIYLLRAPYDRERLELSIDGKKVALLSESTYTAVSLSPGRHVMLTKFPSLFAEGTDAAPPIELYLKADQRRFFNVSGITSKLTALAGVLPIPSGGGVPLLIQRAGTVDGTRSWKEVTELDAQGLMSISKLVLPERNAF